MSDEKDWREMDDAMLRTIFGEEAVSLEEFREMRLNWATAIDDHCPSSPFLNRFAAQWFVKIAPKRAEMYGTKGLFRFGPKGVAAQILNCYSRFERNPDWRSEDTLLDLFGFGVLFAIVSEVSPADLDWEWVFTEGDSAKIFDQFVERAWEPDKGDVPLLLAAETALALAYSAWKESLR